MLSNYPEVLNINQLFSPFIDHRQHDDDPNKGVGGGTRKKHTKVLVAALEFLLQQSIFGVS